MKRLYIMELSVIISILNILDGIFTNFGVSNNFIDELNPLMKHLTLFSPTLFLALKFFLSFMVVYVAYCIVKNGTTRFKKLFSISLFFVCILYTGIFSMHLIWISYL